MDFTHLAAALLSSAQSLLQQWLPAGKVRGHEFVVGNLAGQAGDSLSININTGRWSDFAAGDKGGDLISLYAAIHHISQGDAAAQLEKAHSVTGSVKPGRQPKPQAKRREVIAPVPAGVPACPCHHHKYGAPSRVWEYRDAAGALLGYVARYDLPDKSKEYIPWTYAKDGGGKSRWGMGSWPEPRPLYGLDDLAKRPAAPVLIVEGEKAADAARKIVDGKAAYVVVTWPGGSNAWGKSNWALLAGREILLWPDADDPGVKCMWAIGHLLFRSCRSVKIILPDDKPKGWDAADAVAAGWDWERLKNWGKAKQHEINGGENDRTAKTQSASQAAGFTDSRLAAPRAPTATGLGQGAHGDSEVPNGTTGDSGRFDSNGEISYTSHVGKWQAWDLAQSGNGQPYSNAANVGLVLEQDPVWRGQIWYDEFLDRILCDSKPAPREWSDADDILLLTYLQRHLGMPKMAKSVVRDAVVFHARRYVRNCVREWMDSLIWDEVPRIDDFFSDHFSSENTIYSRGAARNFWLSIAARTYRPGCQMDNVIVLEGKQGTRKTSALRAVGGDWYAEQAESVSNSKAFAENIQGKLLVEISEMDSFKRAEVTAVKAMVTRTKDRFRQAYGFRSEDYPRRCVFAVTTNVDDWNKDETGARRFWPVRCGGSIDTDGIMKNREQLFAEAVSRFKAGESWWEMPEEETRAEQRNRYDGDAWLDVIYGYLGPKADTTVLELLTECIGRDVDEITQSDKVRVTACLRAMAWEVQVERSGRGVKRVWRPANG